MKYLRSMKMHLILMIVNATNIIDEIVHYDYSTMEKSGPRIMSLHPQDDNRDGVAIRIASERLLRRSHNQRFLIVFSDGEPSKIQLCKMVF